MESIAKFEQLLAKARTALNISSALSFQPFYPGPFIDTFLYYAEYDNRLTKRFLRLVQRLEIEKAGSRASNLKRTCGAHKAEIPRQNVGARDGYRIIYYAHVPGEVHFIMMYSKADQTDLTVEQEKMVCQIIERIKKEAKTKRRES